MIGLELIDGILFVAFWIGGAALHTVFELKIKERIAAKNEAADGNPYYDI